MTADTATDTATLAVPDTREGLIAGIDRLRKERNAIVLAHYYQVGVIQDVAGNDSEQEP